MLVSSSTHDYSSTSATNSTSSMNQSARIRIRTLQVCESSIPSRDIVRKENYARRQAQKHQGWTCPPWIPYEGIDPVELPTEPSKQITNVETVQKLPVKAPPRATSAVSRISSRPKSSSSGQTDDNMKMQYETTIRRLHTAEQKHLRKSSEILKNVQLGRSIKDVFDRYPRLNVSRQETSDVHGSNTVISDDRESDVAYDRLLDDFEEDEENESVSVSDIRDDIMSPRTITNTNVTGTVQGDSFEFSKALSSEPSIIPVKLCQSAPPLNRSNIRQATLRPFTPRYSGLSARLRLTRHMPFRDALYRQLCCILWLLRSMCRLDWSEPLSGCWNIDQWLRNDSRSHLNHYQQQQQHIKKQHETNKDQRHLKPPIFEKKSALHAHDQKETALAALRSVPLNAHNQKKMHVTIDSNSSRIGDQTNDEPVARRSTFSETSERLDFQPSSSINIDNDLNESVSSKSNLADGAESSPMDGIQILGTTRSIAATPAPNTANTSRAASISTQQGQLSGRALTGRLTAIMERRRSPDALLKKWMKSRQIKLDDSNEPIPLKENEIRLLRVGDDVDLKRIFGLENATDVNKDPNIERERRTVERKRVSNIKPRPMTSVGTFESRRHSQILAKIRRDFNDFTEEQSIILNNRLDQIDNERVSFCQKKLRDLQNNMPPLTILDRLLKHIRYDEGKKKNDAAHLKYQSWYIDLLQMVQPDYTDDHIIMLLLKEMEELADPSEKPTVIRFKNVLSNLRPHEICNPDVMAAIEFLRIHLLRMSNEDFDKFFFKQFPMVTKYLSVENETNEKDDDTQESKSVA